jgi:nucleotide sugar dehydrogenase
MPGPKYLDSIRNFYRVYSGINSESADATEKFLKTIIRTDEYPLTRLKSTNATEIAKVLENSYRAMNIAFMAEWSRFAEEACVDLHEVVNAIRMRDTHNNMMLPGIGVGGYCLTKDPLLASWSRQNIFKSGEGLPQSEQSVRINDQMPLFAFEYMKQQLGLTELKGLRVLLLGVTYRGDVGDTRHSPVEWFYQLLNRAGCKVQAHDYFIAYWTECDLAVERNLETALAEEYDIIAVTTGHSEYRNNATLIATLSRMPQCLVYDTIGLLSEAELHEIARVHRVCVLGRGTETISTIES